MNYNQKRKYYRLRYPSESRPVIRLDGKPSAEIISELSEHGVRILIENAHQLHEGDHFSGVIPFPDGSRIEVEGIALRTHGNEISAHLSKGPCLKRMFDEQIRMRHLHPWFDKHKDGEGDSHS